MRRHECHRLNSSRCLYNFTSRALGKAFEMKFADTPEEVSGSVLLVCGCSGLWTLRAWFLGSWFPVAAGEVGRRRELRGAENCVEANCPEWYDDLMSSSAESIFELSLSEKLQLVEDLWDDIASTPEKVPVHDWQKEELARRKQNLLSSPGSALSWHEIQRRVHSRYDR
jgi:putative addiction module component (TIGR02574 family)